MILNDEVQQCFAECTAVDTPDPAWQQAQLRLSRGGLGLCRVSYHSPAAYLASAIISGLSSEVCKYLQHLYNHLVDPPDSLLILSITSLPHSLRSSCQTKGLHMEPSEFQVAIKWWLGIPVAHGQSCSQCNAALDAFGHRALCCKLEGDVVSCHNRLRDIFNDFCHRACLAPQLEMAYLTLSQGPEHQKVMYNIGHAQDHSLLHLGHQCKLTCKTPEICLEACCGGRPHHPCIYILMYDDPRGPDSVRDNMDSWHLGRIQCLTITLYQPETLKGQGGD